MRWNSTNDMLERMLLLKDLELVECLAKPEWAQKFALKLGEWDWVLMENIVGVLMIFQKLTEQLNHTFACVSEVISCVTMLLKSLERTGPRGKPELSPLRRTFIRPSSIGLATSSC